jgi:hypothetical protein
MGGFISTSAFRVWQIKTHNKDVTLGVAAILASYLPAYLYYSYHRQKQAVFIREISAKYSERLNNDSLS